MILTLPKPQKCPFLNKKKPTVHWSVSNDQHCAIIGKQNLVLLLIIDEHLLIEQLREEYGYEINPNDPQFASRIEEKEKEIAKIKKKEKREHKEAQREAYQAQQDAEREERIAALKQSTQEKEAS